VELVCGWRDSSASAPWMSTGLAGVPAPAMAWGVALASQHQDRGCRQPDCGSDPSSLFSERSGTGERIDGRFKSWGPRRGRSALPQDQLKHPQPPPIGSRRAGNNAAGRPFWNVERVDTAQSESGNGSREPSLGEPREAAISLFKGHISSSRWAAQPQGVLPGACRR